MATLVSSLQYTSQSEKPGQNCQGCQFFTAEADGRGKCSLFAEGLVQEAGWCQSWVKKVT